MSYYYYLLYIYFVLTWLIDIISFIEEWTVVVAAVNSLTKYKHEVNDAIT